jgi:hypothetical protein
MKSLSVIAIETFSQDVLQSLNNTNNTMAGVVDHPPASQEKL